MRAVQGIGHSKLNIHFITTACHMGVSGTLHKLFPAVFQAPAMMRALAQGKAPYTEVVWHRRRDLVIAVVVVLGAAYALSRLFVALFLG